MVFCEAVPARFTLSYTSCAWELRNSSSRRYGGEGVRDYRHLLPSFAVVYILQRHKVFHPKLCVFFLVVTVATT